MKNSHEIFKNFDYIDSITLVNNKGIIISQFRYNPRFSEEENEIDNRYAIGKNLLDLIPTVSLEESTLMRTLNTGKIVHMDKQIVWDHRGRKLVSETLNIPIVSRGKVIGALEISKDLTQIDACSQISNVDVVKKTVQNSKQTAKYTLDDIITVNKKMNALKGIVKKIANTNSNVMVYGETGTGKEIIVQAIHNESYRKFKRFIPVNCAAIPENLLEGMLFGTMKGSFTGSETREGLFERAKGGTVYLDEINSMAKHLQAKLLRAIQERVIYRVGGDFPIDIDVRIVASSNLSAERILEDGILRKDLFYRLNVVQITIPDLKNRKDDIPILVEYFVKKYNKELSKNIKFVDDEVFELFFNYSWPGNVRELEHVIEGAMNTVEEEGLYIHSLPVYLSAKKVQSKKIEQNYNLKEEIEKYEKEIIAQFIKQSKHNLSEVARRLNIPRTTLQYKIEKYKIEL